MSKGYWIAGLLLVVLGILGSLSIGLPFLLVGGAMLVLGPLRHHPIAFWPPMAAVVAYNVTFWAVAPFSCSATSVPGAASIAATCSSLLGVPWQAVTADGFAAQNDQIIRLSLVAAIVTFIVVLVVQLRRRRVEPADATP